MRNQHSSFKVRNLHEPNAVEFWSAEVRLALRVSSEHGGGELADLVDTSGLFARRFSLLETAVDTAKISLSAESAEGRLL